MEDQHHDFHDGFEAMETYFRSVQKDASLYDGNKTRELIEKFGDVFVKHLVEEIEYIAPENMAKIFDNVEEFKKGHEKMMKWLVSTASKLTTMPWVNLFIVGLVDHRL